MGDLAFNHGQYEGKLAVKIKEPIEPKMILVDEGNRFVEYLEGAKHVQQVH